MAKSLLAIITLLVLSTAVWLWSIQDDPLQEQTNWYQMIWHGENVGYMREESVQLGDVYLVRTETEVSTISQGQPYRFRETKHLTFSATPPHRLEKSYYYFNAPGQQIETRLDYRDDALSGTLENNGEIQSVVLPVSELTLSSFRQIKHWIQSRPAENDILSVILPDSTSAQLSESTYRINDIDNGQFIVHYHSDNQTEQRVIEMSPDGDILAYRYDSVIELVRVANKDQLVMAGDVDLYRSKLLAIDKPLGLTNEIAQLNVLTEPWFNEYISIDNRQSLSGNNLVLSADVSVIAGSAPNITNHIDELSFKTRERLSRMAKVAVNGKTDKLEQLTALREYVSNYMSDTPRVSITSIESLLDNPEGDCTEHTQLFNALAKTLNFHARTVNGLVYLGDKERGFAGHQWSEVYVDGYWVSFDPTWNINSLSATHIRLNQDKADSLYRYIKTANSPGITLVSKR